MQDHLPMTNNQHIGSALGDAAIRQILTVLILTEQVIQQVIPGFKGMVREHHEVTTGPDAAVKW